MNILVVAAHHDDLELGCGATVAKLRDEGHEVISLVMTHSGYSAPNGKVIRAREAGVREAKNAASVLGIRNVSFDEDTFDVEVRDSNVCKILTLLEEHRIDMVFTHWHGDTHPPHRKISQMTLHACRNVPRVLGFAVNWYLGELPFNPNFFVHVSESQFSRKLEALACYESEHSRAGGKWVEYLDRQTLNYGAQLGVSRAEGFIAYKFLWGT